MSEHAEILDEVIGYSKITEVKRFRKICVYLKRVATHHNVPGNLLWYYTTGFKCINKKNLSDYCKYIKNDSELKDSCCIKYNLKY